MCNRENISTPIYVTICVFCLQKPWCIMSDLKIPLEQKKFQHAEKGCKFAVLTICLPFFSQYTEMNLWQSSLVKLK